MSPRSKREYVEAIFLRYKKASRKEKTTILGKFWGVRCQALTAKSAHSKYRRLGKSFSGTGPTAPGSRGEGITNYIHNSELVVTND